jgi:hypothetical protein
LIIKNKRNKKKKIKEEAKVSTMFLGLQRGLLGEWPPPKSQRGVGVSTLACEVEKFRLVMFQDKPKAVKQIEDNLIHPQSLAWTMRVPSSNQDVPPGTQTV